MIGRGNPEGAKAAFGAQNAASRADSQQDTLTESRRRKGREGGKKFHRDLRSRGGVGTATRGLPREEGETPREGGRSGRGRGLDVGVSSSSSWGRGENRLKRRA